jgi:hypothetical protein
MPQMQRKTTFAIAVTAAGFIMRKKLMSNAHDKQH